MSIKYLYLVAVASVVGCASGPPAPTLSTGLPRKANVLTAEEIIDAHADVNTAYDAVARLRPNWLASHGVTSGQVQGAGTEYALVFFDGQQFGDISSLRNIPAFHVGAIRYYDVTQAGARFGIRGGSSGVIEVTSKNPGRP
jgi:hypothetical protein